METWRKAWSLLNAREKRNALLVLAVAVLAAATSTAMVGAVMPFLAVLSDPGRIATTPALAWLYDRLGFRSAYGFLMMLGVGALAVIIVATAMQMLSTYAVARFAQMRVHSLSHRLMARYLGQPYEFFLDHHSGDMGTRVLAEAGEVVSRCLRPAAVIVTSLLTILALLAFLLWVSPGVSIVAFAVLGGSYGLVYAITRARLRKLGVARAAANAERFRMASEALGGVKDIKLLGREAAYVDRFRVPSQRLAKVDVKIQLLSQLPQLVIQAVAFGGIILLCLVLVRASDFEGGEAIGAIVPLLGVFALAGQRMMPELSRLYGSIAVMQSGRAVVDLVHADLVRGDGRPLPRVRVGGLGLRQEMRLDAISYRYPNAERPGVEGISLTVRAGERIGIVGSTGAGKTTLADIVLGLLRPQSGWIVVDGQVVDDSRVRAWQESVGYVPQDIFLTDSSVRENIALGVPPEEIEDERVQRAARIASLDTFVREQLPEGYDTRVGERGVRLSGGQRQRIGIARAMYHDADLIVFDEATSALDNLTERDVMTAINALPGDKTILMIAHRLSTVKVCDRIVVLDQGRLVAVGPWEELLATSPEFRRIAEVARVA
ncbi:hypothetical protein CCR87_10985 [Rhodobaculum claviforme]|uniref:ABC transporter ATP-binding protein n=1 Tax=Rhodobaculum claviforme TaxID=1549854 RepID=A0A934TLQ9_9RHOB|nr:ABC transporter ATP-binding protein [Rhodobaculum claviforme]MBK5927846.1 hypothetical protein [Rhodobaculum claviforme]